MNQIILITDGCSNVGISPELAAAHALAEDIIVNVAGVIDRGEIGRNGMQEIERIARAGGGMSRIVAVEQLSETVQMMTRKTVAHTIKSVVQQELKQIMGDDRIEALPPEQRSRVVDVMDRMAETARLRVALLVDTSASMKPKLSAVIETVKDLLLSLQARKGESAISVFHFPHSSREGDELGMDLAWTTDLAKTDNLFYKCNMKGSTPTGPALLQLVRFLVHGGGREADDEASGYRDDSYLSVDSRRFLEKGGILS